MKSTINDWCEASLQIWIGDDEAIHYDSLFSKRWLGSFNRLLESVSNSSCDSGDIDWAAVRDEYSAWEKDDN